MQATEAPADRQPSPLGRSAAIKALAMDPSLAQKLGKPEREVEMLLAEEYDRIGWLRFYLLRGWWKPRYGLDELDLRAAREEWSDERFELEARAFQSREIDRRMIVDVYKACLRGVNRAEEVLRYAAIIRARGMLEPPLDAVNYMASNEIARIGRPPRVSPEEIQCVRAFAEETRGDAQPLVQLGTATFPSALSAWLRLGRQLVVLWNDAVCVSEETSARTRGKARPRRTSAKLPIECLADKIDAAEYLPILHRLAEALNEERTVALNAERVSEPTDIATDRNEEVPPDQAAGEPPEPEAVLTMVHTGQCWDVFFKGARCTLCDTPGARELAYLISHPNSELSAFDLYLDSNQLCDRVRKLVSDKQIHREEWRVIEKKRRDWQDQFDRAKKNGDYAAEDAARRELDDLGAYVRDSTHNGRSKLDLDDIDAAARRVAPAVRRARDAITKECREFSAYFEGHFQLGRTCRYRP